MERIRWRGGGARTEEGMKLYRRRRNELSMEMMIFRDYGEAEGGKWRSTMEAAAEGSEKKASEREREGVCVRV
jgi:hypothetical protein